MMFIFLSFPKRGAVPLFPTGSFIVMPDPIRHPVQSILDSGFRRNDVLEPAQSVFLK
jgi:hypothetical protein